MNGSCVVESTNGTAFNTSFILKCSNWYDPDGNIKSYEFYGTQKKSQQF